MNRRRRLWWFGAAAGAAAVCFSASLLLARPGVVKTLDGKTLEGEIEEKPDQVIVTLHGIKTAVNRDNVDGQVQYFDNVEAQYKAKVAQLPKKPSAADRLALARWLFGVKAYDLALTEIAEAQRIDPNSAEAQTLEQTVLSQRRIEMNQAPGTGTTGTGATGTGTRPPGNTGGAPTTTAAGAAADKARYLTADDINVIRQVEWRKDDTTVPRATVPVKVRKEYVDMKGLNPGEFAKLSMPEQAYVILTDPQATPEMRQQIKITTDPQALAEYRRVVQPVVLNNCATTGCHGGHHAGQFFLFFNNPERDDVAYTNFYILQNYSQKLGDKEYLMVDRSYPERSILSQFALAPEVAEVRHPKLEGHTYKPISVSKQAPGYKTLIAWMKDLEAAGPNYGISYELPTSSPKKAAPPAPPKNEAPKTGGGGGTAAPAPKGTAAPAKQ
jgi:hypothetical protein